MSPDEKAGPPLRFDLGPRAAWGWLTAGVSLLGVAEVLGLAAAFHALLPDPVAWALDALVAIPTSGLLLLIASGLTARLTVDAEQLELRFGLLGGAVVPRTDIDRAERFEPPSIRPVGLGIDVPAGSRQATVSRGGQVPFVRILLLRPVEVRTALWRHDAADELVMATREPEQLIAALA